MARTLHRLSPLEVLRKRKPGLYADGGNLYLSVSNSISKSWIFRYSRNGKTKDMGLGPLNAVSLAQARELAGEYRNQLVSGIDPLEARKVFRQQAAAEAARVMTFREAAETYMRAKSAGWRSVKHREAWRQTLDTYVFPVLGDVPVNAVDVGLVMKVVEPIWTTKTETASRVRGRIELVLDWAKARGLRFGDNPAHWRGHLQNLLPSPKKVRPVQHHPALPYDEIGSFIEKLRAMDGVAAATLEYLILTAARTSEVTGAKWSEIDMDSALWTIPPERIKAGKEHRIPLPTQAMEVLARMLPLRTDGNFVFPGRNKRRGLSNVTMLSLMDRMGYGHLTVHGFRSTLRDWAAETTNFPREVAEMALAHAVSDSVEAAYRRGDLFGKRRQFLKAWADYCDKSPTVERRDDNLVRIGAA